VDQLDAYWQMVLLFVLTLIFRDMVPLMFYLVTLISGIALVT
jgi:hypothetical protein